jgi:hypothetical protein
MRGSPIVRVGEPGRGQAGHAPACSTMGFERRGGGSYYYRKVRRDGRVVSEYVGSGPLAWVKAWRVAFERVRRDARRASWEVRRARMDADEAEAVALFDEVEAVAREVLEAAGYHRHKRGEWRKRRGDNQDSE